MFGRRFLDSRWQYKWVYHSLIHTLQEITNAPQWTYDTLSHLFTLTGKWKYDESRHALVWETDWPLDIGLFPSDLNGSFWPTDLSTSFWPTKLTNDFWDIYRKTFTGAEVREDGAIHAKPKEGGFADVQIKYLVEAPADGTWWLSIIGTGNYTLKYNINGGTKRDLQPQNTCSTGDKIGMFIESTNSDILISYISWGFRKGGS